MYVDFTPAPRVVPRPNLGCLLDVPTGEFLPGMRGEMILNGGLVGITSIAGPGNVGKSELTLYMAATALGRYKNSHWHLYDTENSMEYQRIERALSRYPEFHDMDISEANSRFLMVKSDEHLGDKWFDSIKKHLTDRTRNKSKLMEDTAFRGASGNPIKAMPNFNILVDSLTMFTTSTLQESIVDKNSVGDSKQNMLFAKDGAAKTIFISQLPNLTSAAGATWMLVAHIGMKIVFDPYAPVAPKLAHARAGRKAKGVPEKFTLINGHLLEISDSALLKNSSKDKSAKYPLTEMDRSDDCRDLMCINAISTRNKTGPSGVNFKFITSQRSGIEPTLTEFDYLKRNSTTSKEPGWGMGGNAQHHYLELYPDVTVSRTNVRKAISESHRFTRAVELTSNMHQIISLWDIDTKEGKERIDTDLIVPMDVLYRDLIAKGFDMDDLLNTRGYWLPPTLEEGELPYLSIYDMLRMRVGKYTPYWHKK